MVIIMIFVFFLSVMITFIMSSVQHPTGFANISQCLQNGATVIYLLEEKNGTKQFVLSLRNGIVVGQGGIVTSDGKILADTETYKQDQEDLLHGNRYISKDKLISFNGNLAVMSSPGQQ
ncbi:MAG TPA: hypothetical protein VHA52_04035, partial [Candidatus Babeliaceae bacterium]|nr:hypothetical protein [Candidatus Babeliaceae bacterium]